MGAIKGGLFFGREKGGWRKEHLTTLTKGGGDLRAMGPLLI